MHGGKAVGAVKDRSGWLGIEWTLEKLGQLKQSGAIGGGASVAVEAVAGEAMAVAAVELAVIIWMHCCKVADLASWQPAAVIPNCSRGQALCGWPRWIFRGMAIEL